jgi:hypothetical protein
VKYIIGAYATAPSLAINNKSAEHEFYDNLVESIPGSSFLGWGNSSIWI